MQLTLIAVPYDSGRLLERTGAGPRHLLSSGLPEQLRSADHDVEVVEILLSDGFHTEVTGGVELMRRAAEAIRISSWTRRCSGPSADPRVPDDW
jgi:hypothetical protein